jgi:hypothetical protein
MKMMMIKIIIIIIIIIIIYAIGEEECKIGNKGN